MRRTALALACIVFLAWFSMTFYMDNSNDSETSTYAAALVSAAAELRVASDANGYYTLLAQYLLYPVANALQFVSGLYLIRGFVFVRFVLGVVVFAAAYAWYRGLGLGWLTSLLGLAVLSICVAFALQIRGWELDKLAEPALYLLAGLAAWHRRWIAFLIVASLAALNRETGVLVPLVALALGAPRRLVLASAAVCLLLVLSLRVLGPHPQLTPTLELWRLGYSIERIVYVVGGLCLTPVFAVAWLRRTQPELQRLFWYLAPGWLLWLLATERIEQGAGVLSLVALVFVPITLAGARRSTRAVLQTGAHAV